MQAQYTASDPATPMVFMDGANYAKSAEAFRVPIVLDKSIHQQAISAAIAVLLILGRFGPPNLKPRTAATVRLIRIRWANFILGCLSINSYRLYSMSIAAAVCPILASIIRRDFDAVNPLAERPIADSRDQVFDPGSEGLVVLDQS